MQSHIRCILCTPMVTIGTLLSQETMVKHLLEEEEEPSPGGALKQKLYKSKNIKKGWHLNNIIQ